MKLEIEIPEWVRWMAQNIDGYWYGFSAKPYSGQRVWFPQSYTNQIILAKGIQSDNWKNELYKIYWE